MLCYVMEPLLHTHQRRKQLGWWLYATSVSGKRAPATEYIWMPKCTLVRRWVHIIIIITISNMPLPRLIVIDNNINHTNFRLLR
jgi:hypothetical protein